jgi:hypothetical protein
MQRRSTAHVSVTLAGYIATLVDSITMMLDQRPGSACRSFCRVQSWPEGVVLLNAVSAAQECIDDRGRLYELLQTIGKNAASIMLPLPTEIIRRFFPDEHGC